MEISAIVPGWVEAFSERPGTLNCAGGAAGGADARPNAGGNISGERAGEENMLLTGPGVNTRAGGCSSPDIASREGAKAGKNPSCASGNSAAHMGALTSWRAYNA